MSKVEVRETVEASAQQLWDLIKGFEDIARWARGIESCEVEGEGVGAVRTIGMPGGAKLTERLESYDEDARTFQYSIIGENPLPLSDYLATVKVIEDGPERCTVDWSGEFEPKGAPEEQAKTLVEGIYTGGIKSMRKSLGL